MVIVDNQMTRRCGKKNKISANRAGRYITVNMQAHIKCGVGKCVAVSMHAHIKCVLNICVVGKYVRRRCGKHVQG